MRMTDERRLIKYRSQLFKQHLDKIGFKLPCGTDYFANPFEFIRNQTNDGQVKNN